MKYAILFLSALVVSLSLIHGNGFVKKVAQASRLHQAKIERAAGL